MKTIIYQSLYYIFVLIFLVSLQSCYSVLGVTAGAIRDKNENNKPWGQVLETKVWVNPEIKATPVELVLKDSSRLSGKYWLQSMSPAGDSLRNMVVLKTSNTFLKVPVGDIASTKIMYETRKKHKSKTRGFAIGLAIDVVAVVALVASGGPFAEWDYGLCMTDSCN